ncbi:unnamed protein product, partial [Mesorhabditis spiculigera]
MTYKLYYFNGRGVAEPARQLFKLAGKEFEDVRYTHDTWPAHKSEQPFGQLPVLEVNGHKIAQSGAIFRYLAKEFHLGGKDHIEQALVDSFFELYKDYVSEARNFFYIARGMREGNKEEAHEKEYVPARDKFFGALEKQLKNNDSGFLVGSNATYVDLQVADHVHSVLALNAHELDQFPEVLKHHKKIEALPQIAKWIKERPASDF